MTDAQDKGEHREALEAAREKFAAFWMPEPNSGCWLWMGAITGRGYGSFHFSGKSMVAHRVSYRLAVGEIPIGKVLDHKCRNRACVNPAHLRPVTDTENILLGVGAPALNKLKTHCKRGHALVGKNVIARYDGTRGCRACKYAWARKQTRRALEEPHGV